MQVIAVWTRVIGDGESRHLFSNGHQYAHIGTVISAIT